jgi:TRAP-type transport system periplasmic protein
MCACCQLAVPIRPAFTAATNLAQLFDWNSQLGSTPRMIEGTQLGSIQSTSRHPNSLSVSTDVSSCRAAGLVRKRTARRQSRERPGVFQGLSGRWRQSRPDRHELFIGAPVAYVMRRPLRMLADFRGKKIRVLASPSQTEQVTRIGGTAVPMSLAGVLPALQQGTIDGSLGASTCSVRSAITPARNT